MSDRSIVLISNEPWEGIRFSKHHYAMALAKRYPTYFVDPPTRSQLVSDALNIEAIAAHPGLHRVSYSRSMKSKLMGKDVLMDQLIDRIGGEVILWQFDPFRFRYGSERARRIYHVVDPYHEAEFDHDIATNSDLIVCVNDMIAAQYGAYGDKVMILPHAFEGPASSGSGGKDLLLAGTLNHSIELGMLKDILDLLSDRDLRFVGQLELEDSAALRAVTEHPRFRHQPPVGRSELGEVIASALCCLVPYTTDGLHGFRSPLKINSYIQHGRPVITTNGNFIAELAGAGVYHAPDRERFIELVKKGIAGELGVDTGKIGEIVSSHGYDQAVDRILNVLDGD